VIERGKTAGILLLGALATAMALGTVFAAGAGAEPRWRFNGVLLNETETVVGSPTKSSLTFPGLTTKCEVMSYEMEIWNAGPVGRGKITGLSFEGCSTDSSFCPVESIGAEALPWSLHLATVSLKNYVIVESVKVAILYGGEECPLGGITATVTGSAGGLFNNVGSTITFTPSSFLTTKTELKALKSKIEWNAQLSTEATGPHSGQALEVG